MKFIRVVVQEYEVDEDAETLREWETLKEYFPTFEEWAICVIEEAQYGEHFAVRLIFDYTNIEKIQ